MTNPNDPATPTLNKELANCGLTKREYFAAMAMIGSCAWRSNAQLDPRKQKVDDISNEALALADALIAELNKGNGK